MASTRRLVAILALDVAGYSRLMSVDEEGTHERLKAHRRELVDPKIGEHSGRIVKTTGDGMLVEFPSVVDVVRCAAELQRTMIDREAGMSQDRRIRFRIGINLGDIIVDGDDIFGDGVNVAARLEALADPGGLCISRMVRDQIRDKLAYVFEDLGEQSVKNIARSVRVYALRPKAVAELPTSTVLPAPPISRPAVLPRLSIVVLPFANLSNDPEQQYFADGITEDLTTDLSRIADMFVISRNTAFTYKDKRVDTKQIGRDLGVRYLLEGSVRRSGNQIRVNAQLIDSAYRRASVGRAVRRRHGRSVRAAKRGHEPDRGRAQPRAARRGGCSADRAPRRFGVYSPRARRIPSLPRPRPGRFRLWGISDKFFSL
jgi:adenylate cyclase